MTAFLPWVFLAASLAQEPLTIRVFVTQSDGEVASKPDFEDLSKWNRVRLQNREVMLAKELDSLVSSRAALALTQLSKGYPDGLLVKSESLNPRDLLALREVLLRSPGSAGLAGKVGRSTHPKVFLVPSGRVELMVDGKTLVLRPDSQIERVKDLAMSEAESAPAREADEFDRRWRQPSLDEVFRRIELHVQGPFSGIPMLEATHAATQALLDRGKEVQKEIDRAMQDEIQSVYGTPGWTKADRFDQLPEAFARKLDADVRARYQELGFASQDAASSALRSGKLRVAGLSLLVAVREGNFMQAFDLGSLRL